MDGKAFDVDPAVLKQQGAEFVGIGTEFGSASKKLQDTLNGLGKPWTGADFADAFETVYEPVRDGMFTSMDSLGKRLEGMGDNLQEMGKGYEASDLDNVQVISYVTPPAV
ncbi:WXG100 family type VII secretion target [Streptomyces celluloflavus]|uniref:WXG100 family type VII secretion target n=1 Tax=Streptomyces celluloflavus TaxID=58344 RepID=UPI0036B7A0E9